MFSDYSKIPLNRQQHKKVVRIIHNLLNMPQSIPFRKPVCYRALGLDDYKQIVRKPIDLNMIRRTNNQWKYKFVQQVLDDIQLCWNNCRAYNKPQSDIYQAAVHMEKQFVDQLIQQYPQYQIPPGIIKGSEKQAQNNLYFQQRIQKQYQLQNAGSSQKIDSKSQSRQRKGQSKQIRQIRQQREKQKMVKEQKQRQAREARQARQKQRQIREKQRQFRQAKQREIKKMSKSGYSKQNDYNSQGEGEDQINNDIQQLQNNNEMEQQQQQSQSAKRKDKKTLKQQKSIKKEIERESELGLKKRQDLVEQEVQQEEKPTMDKLVEISQKIKKIKDRQSLNYIVQFIMKLEPSIVSCKDHKYKLNATKIRYQNLDKLNSYLSQEFQL